MRLELRKDWRPAQRILANVFIVFFILRSVIMCWPFGQYLNLKQTLQPINALSSYLGLYANISLFSPDPPRYADDIKFVVEFDDGSFSEWAFPRDKMTPWDSEHSFRQYVHNLFFWSAKPALAAIHPDEARYIARQVSTQTRHPVEIYFFHAITDVPPPSDGIGQPLMTPQSYKLFYSYTVAAGDLK